MRALRARIGRFWRHAGALLAEAGGADRIEEALGIALREVHPALVAELDRGGGAPRVVVDPGDAPGLEPILEEILQGVPRAEGVRAARHRPEVGVEEALRDVRERTGLDLRGARARLGFSRGHLLETVVSATAFGSRDDERALDAANLLVPRLVGGEIFDHWFGAVDVAPLPRGGPLRVLRDDRSEEGAPLALAEILPAAEAAVRSVYDALPELPYHRFCERAEWTLLELDTAPGSRNIAEDLTLVTTMIPEATKCYLAGERFSSRRFSRHGERFAQVVIDAEGTGARERQERRVAIEDALDLVLVPGGIGCVVGAGIGEGSVVVHLALVNATHGVQAVADGLRRLGVPERAWITFWDAGWEAEWVGVYEGTPPPPTGAHAGAGPGAAEE